MVQTFGTDENNDIYIAPDGKLAVLSGIEAVAGACETKTKAQLGEMIYETDQGMPSLQAILGIGVPNYAIYQTYLRSNIMSIDGVIGIESIKMSPLKNDLDYTATIQTQFGTVNING